VCTPQCSGKECGADGCGGTCGTCSGAKSCSGGTCVCNDTLQPGQSLGVNQSLTNCKGNVTLVMQTDGNLVVYGPPGALWSSNTAGTPANVAVMQGDGNFVLYNGSTPYWDSKTAGYSGAHLVVQDDGNVVIYLGNTPLWSTNTCCY
jgi:hypothetical protein